MLVKIAIGFVAVIVLFVIVVALQSSTFRVARSTKIAAAPAAVFPQVNDLHNWEAWNPWGKIDPAMKLTYEGPESGVGAAYHWDGNSQVGAGSATITDSRSDDLVQLRLDFLKPFKNTCVAEFDFQPDGDATTVTWTMDGKKNFIGKAMGLFISMDSMVGDQFERGLADLKAVVEATPQG
ncbi:MAG TPA: SRPBCC family protein [Pirellulales bacterium]|jgi:hypothetical protein